MGNSNKRIQRNRTDHVRIYKKDWLIVDEVAGEDRPMKDGFHDIIEGYKEFRGMKEADLSDVLEGS